jgi:hypothetical protein
MQHTWDIIEPTPSDFLGHRDLFFTFGIILERGKTRSRALGNLDWREHRAKR